MNYYCCLWHLKFTSLVLLLWILLLPPRSSSDYRRRSRFKLLEIAWYYISKSGNWLVNTIDSKIATPRKIRLRRRLARARGQFRGSKRIYAGVLLGAGAGIDAYSAIAMPARIANSMGEPIHVFNSVFDTDSSLVGVDNRCSACISHEKKDFIGELTPVNRAIKGFGGVRKFPVQKGQLKWTFADDNGVRRTFVIDNSYYIPDGGIRLLSPQHWAREIRSLSKGKSEVAGETTYFDKCILFWNNRRNQITIPMDKHTNVASFRLATGYNDFNLYCQEAKIDYGMEMINPVVAESTVVSDDECDDDQEPVTPARKPRWYFWNKTTGMPTTPYYDDGKEEPAPTQTDFNLNLQGPGKLNDPVIIPQEEDRRDLYDDNHSAQLLRFHHRMGHISFHKLQWMAKQKIIPERFAKCKIPSCSACLFGKATRRQWRTKTRKNYTPKAAPSRPGQVISVDQLDSAVPGFISQMTGRLTLERYKYATVFVDQYSRYSYVYPQKSSSADETLMAKKAFELRMKEFGVKVEGYHCDNGVFRANKWQEACRNEKQNLSFSAVNAHYTNGIAERRIRSLQDLARTMMIHAAHRWPEAITANLWPYAVAFANTSLNEAPSLQDAERRSSLQIISNSQVNFNMNHWRTWGCPTYQLETNLQTSGIHGKWKERSKVGIYLGRSPLHARNVALVLSLETGLVSPQFHVQFDSAFNTVEQEPRRWKSLWQKKAGFGDQGKVNRSTKRKQGSDKTSSKRSRISPPARTSTSGGSRAPEGAPPGEDSAVNLQGVASPTGSSGSYQRQADEQSRQPNQPANSAQGSSSNADSEQLPSQNGRAQSQQNAGPPAHQDRGAESNPVQRVEELLLAELAVATSNGVEGEIFVLESLFPDHAQSMEEENHPLMAFKASADPDTMYLHEARRQPDWKDFEAALQKEWRDQRDNGNYVLVLRSDLPKDTPILPSVWQMKRKRSMLTGEIRKYKARLNIDGSKMKYGRDYDQTYSPVASWNSIRTLLTLVAVNGWYTKQIDYVLAFPQAPVDRPLYMSIPKGFDLGCKDDPRKYALLLKRNVYGQPQSGRVWNKHLVKILTSKKVGFVQSKIDECVFYRGKVMYVLYTDDSILAGPSKSEIDEVIELIRKAKLDITVEGDLTDFLGVHIERKQDNTISLTQPQLIDQILKDIHLYDQRDLKTKDTPAASSRLLSRHSKSPDFDKSFNYRSIIGKLGYLEKGSRSDIAYIVHQLARFSTCPKKEHGDAVRWLGRYLKGTRDMGTIYRPDKTRGLEVHVDADFAGNWDKEEANDPDTARSRHGFIISYAGCPILWKSQLQGEITLSSTESEYVGLSYALREAIPIMELLKEMKSFGFKIKGTEAKVHCKVFEDNSGALEMANEHKFRPRTKHINVKLHHFRSYVNSGEISVHKIDTLEQNADYLTKPLAADLLKKLRKKVMGW